MNPRALYLVACRGCDAVGCKGGVVCADGTPHHAQPPAVCRKASAEPLLRDADRTCAFRPHRLVPYLRRGG